ncbi:MAG: hypothetical protein ACC653_06430 [Gammaproteobacteria bacterium]
MLLVVAVVVFIISIPRKALLTSLIYLSIPLRIFGFSSEQFAVRIYLVIDFVEELPKLINVKTDTIKYKSKISKIVSSMSLVVNEIYKLAENSECKKIRYDKMILPSFYQWGYLVISLGLFYLSDHVFTRFVF